METYNKNTTPNIPEGKGFRGEPNPSGRIFGGLIVVFVGVVWLLREVGYSYYLPHWLTTWPMLLIAIGFYIGFRHSFRGFGWLIPILVGGAFLAGDIFPEINLREYVWPLVVIIIGIAMMVRPKRHKHWGDWKDWEHNQFYNAESSEDLLDSTVVFGAVKKKVISKNFKGGEAVTVFGGTEINLMQADVDGKIILELTQVFGGTKLIVPPHWKIQTEEVVVILGGIEDKRPLLADASAIDQNKVLVLRGTCIFGGIDIKSY